MDKRIKELRAKAHTLDPAGFIGKDGMSPGTVEELKRQLKEKKLIKIKVSKVLFEGKDKKEVANNIAQALGGVLVEQKGYTVVVAKAW